MKKKITRIIVFLLIFLLALGFSLPFLMEDKVGELLKSNVNSQIDGQFDFSEISLSIYKEFPKAVVILKEVSLANNAPFEGDTLFKAQNIKLRMAIGEFFEGAADPLEIEEFNIDSAKVLLKTNEYGLSNYNISLPSDSTPEEEVSDESTVLAIRSYAISDSELIYRDAASQMLLEIEDFNHKGSGDLSSEHSQLTTETEAVVSLTMDKSKYLDKNTLSLEALIGIDLKSNTYTFKENKAIINRLPISFDGTVRLMEEGQDFDISFKTINSDFKNFLALIPEQYSKDISNLRTEGNFDINAQFVGEYTEETIPHFQINMNAEAASFKYPDLTKKVENIFINALVENTTGFAEDTKIIVDRASFQIDRDTFELQAKIQQLTGNISVDSRARGSIDLNNISEAYPVPASLEMGGKLQADISSAFNIDDIENQKYKKIDLSGNLEVTGLSYSFEALPHPLKVHTLSAELNTRVIDIKEVAGITGSTDFSASGILRNTLGFLFNEEVLKGKFDMRSNSFVVSDLLEAENEEGVTEGENEEAFKIPANLDINIDALVGKAVYDNILMYDLVGNLRIRNEAITFSEISSRMMDGRVVMDGTVSTKDDEPTFDLAMDMSKLNIGKTFEAIELMRMLSPAANALDGRISTKMKLSGKLTEDLDLDLNSISGNVLAELLSTTVNPEKAPVLNLVENQLGFVSLDKLDLSGLKTAFSVENGKVKVEPFTVSYEDLSLEVAGGHSFANALDYQLKFDVPAEYLGDDVNKLLSSINDPSLGEIQVPVVANLGGSYDKPTIKTDVKSQTRALTDQLVEIQKQKYINQGKNKVNELIGNVLAGDSNEPKKEDQDASSNALSEALQNIPKKKVDSSKAVTDNKDSETDVKKAAKSLLNGLLKSKTKAVTAKDTLN